MDKLNEVMQATSLWNVLRTASAWIPKVTVQSSRLPVRTCVCSGPGRSCFGDESDEKQCSGEGKSVAKMFPTERVTQVVPLDCDGIVNRAELAAGHVLDATKDVLADLRKQIAEAKNELEGVNAELAKRKAELAETVSRCARSEPQ